MHLANTFYPLPRRALATAVLGLLLSGNALADYTWSTPSTYNIGNTNNSNGQLSEYAGINNSGTIIGDFSYDPSGGTISGLQAGDYYGFVGSTGVTSNKGRVGPYVPSGTDTPGAYGSGSFYQNNGVTGINNNGYLTFSLATSTGISPGSYVGNSAASPTGGTLLADTNSYAGGDTTLATSAERFSATYAQGLDSGSAGSYGVVVGSAAVTGGGLNTVGFIYNNTGATLDGIANGGYGDFNYGGLSGTAALANNNGITGFTGAADNGGDVYVSGFYLVDGNTYGLIFNASTGSWVTVTDPNTGAAGSGSDVTVVTGLNNVGEAVGYYEDSNGVFHGFTYDYLTHLFINSQLDYVGTIGGEVSTNTMIFGVNDSGTLVGQAQTYDLGGGVGFQAVSNASAVPVPAAFWMMLSGVLAGQGLLRKPRDRKQAA